MNREITPHSPRFLNALRYWNEGHMSKREMRESWKHYRNEQRKRDNKEFAIVKPQNFKMNWTFEEWLVHFTDEILFEEAYDI